MPGAELARLLETYDCERPVSGIRPDGGGSNAATSHEPRCSRSRTRQPHSIRSCGGSAAASPDWPGSGRPAGCRLDAAGYLAFLSDRATTAAIEISDCVVTARGTCRIGARGLDRIGVPGLAVQAPLVGRYAAVAEFRRSRRGTVRSGGLHPARRLRRHRMTGRLLPHTSSKPGYRTDHGDFPTQLAVVC